VDKIGFCKKLALVFLGLFISFVLVEAGLRACGFIIRFTQEAKNAAALRQKGAYRILCLGESTTVLPLGNASYPSQLEAILNKNSLGNSFVVINKGMIAADTSDILEALKDVLDECRPSIVVVMMGVNDGLNLFSWEDPGSIRIPAWVKELKVYKLLRLISFKRKGGKPISPDQYSSYSNNAFQGKQIIKGGIAIDPKSEVDYSALGWYYRDLRDYDRAEKMFEKALQLSPGSEQRYLELAWCYEEHGRYEAARTAFDNAIKLNPQCDKAFGGLGRYFERKGSFTEAEVMYKKAIEANPADDRAYGALAHLYIKEGRDKLVHDYFEKANSLRMSAYNPITRQNYRELKEVVLDKGIILVCVQYPMRSVDSLKRLLEPCEGVIFVDNESVFKEAVAKEGASEYFTDLFGGDFGHCTLKGNRLLAENISRAILKK